MEDKTWTVSYLLAWAVWLGGMGLGAWLVDWVQGKASFDDEMAMLAHLEVPNEADGEARRLPAALDTPEELFAFILRRNLVVYVWLLAGLVSAGAITLLVLFANGIALGQAIAVAVSAGAPVWRVLEMVLPHGVLEVGTFCVAAAAGFQGFRLAVNRSGQSAETLKELRLGLVAAFGLAALTAAAGIEAVITGNLAGHWDH